jgi:hypothetical protein
MTTIMRMTIVMVSILVEKQTTHAPLHCRGNVEIGLGFVCSKSMAND